MNKPNLILLYLVVESEIKKEFDSIEKIIANDNCLPKDIKIPYPPASASKTLLFFDLKEGLCYAFSPKKAPKIDSIYNFLNKLKLDTNLPLNKAKIFEWKEEIITNIIDLAYGKGFNPYKIKADLENVKVIAEGDFNNCEDWTKIESSIDLGKWQNIAYVRHEDLFVFGLTKRLKKQILLPNISTDISMDELFEKILEIRGLLEQAIGCNIKNYCFPDPIKTLYQFSEKNNTN